MIKTDAADASFVSTPPFCCTAIDGFEPCAKILFEKKNWLQSWQHHNIVDKLESDCPYCKYDLQVITLNVNPTTNV